MKKTHLSICSLMAGVAMAAAIWSGNTVSAATTTTTDRISAENIVIDYETQSLRVTTTDDEVLAAFPAVKVKNGEITSVKVSRWDVYDSDYMQEVASLEDAHQATIDVSPINITKGGYVAVRTNATSGIYLIHFSGIRTKLAASYDIEEGSVTVIDKKDDNSECENLEYKTTYGSWQDYNSSEVSLRQYEQQGATLYFREKCGYDDGDEYISSGTLRDSAIASKVGVLDVAPDFVLYEAVNTFAGKQLKVKIPRRKNGPTVKINYAKRTITVGKNLEYRLDPSSSFDETPDDQAEVIEVDDEAGAVEVRTLPKEGAKKYTPASKIARYEYPASRVMNVTDDTDGYLGKKAGKLKITYDSTSKKIELTSTDVENTYLIYVVKDGGDEPIAGSKVAVTVKPAASSDKPRVVKLAPSKMPADSEIYVAYAANAKTQQWATNPVFLGVVE